MICGMWEALDVQRKKNLVDSMEDVRANIPIRVVLIVCGFPDDSSSVLTNHLMRRIL
jgi:hypothetical protein